MKKIIAANWKMNKTRAQAEESAASLVQLCKNVVSEERELVVFPPFLSIPEVAAAFADVSHFAVGAQDVYPAQNGAFTGEISPEMLRDGGAEWILTGHSERRHIIGESDDLIGRKTAFSLQQNFKTMLCIGETLEERETGQLEGVLSRQLSGALVGIPDTADWKTLAVAYEPVWAIGTGKVAGEKEIIKTHAVVRRLLLERFPDFGEKIAILYGGSVKPANASSIILLDNVDGLLVGGASLEASTFAEIVKA